MIAYEMITILYFLIVGKLPVTERIFDVRHVLCQKKCDVKNVKKERREEDYSTVLTMMTVLPYCHSQYRYVGSIHLI